jgi:hypothetical protein
VTVISGIVLSHEFVTITGHNNLPSFCSTGERVLAWVRLHGDQIRFKNPEKGKKKARKGKNTDRKWKETTNVLTRKRRNINKNANKVIESKNGGGWMDGQVRRCCIVLYY